MILTTLPSELGEFGAEDGGVDSTLSFGTVKTISNLGERI
jgi:hypothetical protein